MLRIHFDDADLARTRLARAPDPLWEIASSLHRFQTRRGRWAYAAWHRRALAVLGGQARLARAVRELLLPLYARAAYFPDFLTPPESDDGLAAGLDSIAAAPPERVLREVGRLAVPHAGRSSLLRLAERESRSGLTALLRAYHAAVIAPYADRIDCRVLAERTLRARAVLDGGTEGLLHSFAPAMRWRPPVLEVVDHISDRDIRLTGTGLVLIPSYFCWHHPVTIADPRLPQVLVYPLLRPVPGAPPVPDEQPLTVLLGRTRAAVLRATALGATTGELSRHAGVSPATVSFHLRALRDTGLVEDERGAGMLLHVLTPLGASVLRAARSDGENTTQWS